MPDGGSINGNWQNPLAHCPSSVQPTTPFANRHFPPALQARGFGIHMASQRTDGSFGLSVPGTQHGSLNSPHPSDALVLPSAAASTSTASNTASPIRFMATVIPQSAASCKNTGGLVCARSDLKIPVWWSGAVFGLRRFLVEMEAILAGINGFLRFRSSTWMTGADSGTLSERVSD